MTNGIGGGIQLAVIRSGKLMGHLHEIDDACHDRMEELASQMKEEEGVTETLKAMDQMEWVRRMNSIQCRAEEMILSELIYD